MEAALKSILAWWDESGVDVPKVAPSRARSAPSRRAQAGAQNPAQTRGSMVRKTPASVRPASHSAGGMPSPAQNPAQNPVHDPAQDQDIIAAAVKLASEAKTLAQLQTKIEGFHAGTLSDRARRAVFARGTSEANIMVIGEAPGEAEEAAGKPFVGPAGVLLDKMLASIGLSEEGVYITNAVNWRPPANRRPTEAELAICRPLIKRHIALAQPQIILLLGASAMSALTDHKSITKYRGEWAMISPEGDATDETEIPALMSYHPAYLLRQPHLKCDVWRDMLALRARAAELG